MRFKIALIVQAFTPFLEYWVAPPRLAQLK